MILSEAGSGLHSITELVPPKKRSMLERKSPPSNSAPVLETVGNEVGVRVRVRVRDRVRVRVGVSLAAFHPQPSHHVLVKGDGVRLG